MRSHSLKPQDYVGESDSDAEGSQTVIQSKNCKQFELMLQKALKQTSDHITDKLTREIIELGQRTTELEVRVDEIKNHSQHCLSQFVNLKEENLVLQSQGLPFQFADQRDSYCGCTGHHVGSLSGTTAGHSC